MLSLVARRDQLGGVGRAKEEAAVGPDGALAASSSAWSHLSNQRAAWLSEMITATGSFASLERCRRCSASLYCLRHSAAESIGVLHILFEIALDDAEVR